MTVGDTEITHDGSPELSPGRNESERISVMMLMGFNLCERNFSVLGCVAEHCVLMVILRFPVEKNKYFCTICTLLVFHEWFLFEISFCCWNVKNLRDSLYSSLNREHLA